MNKREGAIVTAYTGILIGDFSEFHKYIEEIMGRPVFTIEMANKKTTKEIKEKSKTDFIKLSESIVGEQQ